MRKVKVMMLPLKKAGRFAVDLLFPPRCIFCENIVPPGRQICQECAKKVNHNAGGLTSVQADGRKIPCAFLYPYKGIVRDSILQFKFHGKKTNACWYAEQLAKKIKMAFPDARFDIVTSVPLFKNRMRERGYNQSELIAMPLANFLHIPYAECLRRVEENRIQHFLGKKARAGNVRGAYLPFGLMASGKCVLLIDDIITTGATLAECSSMLFLGGAKSVCCAVVAHSELDSVEKQQTL